MFYSIELKDLTGTKFFIMPAYTGCGFVLCDQKYWLTYNQTEHYLTTLRDFHIDSYVDSFTDSFVATRQTNNVSFADLSQDGLITINLE